MKKFVYLIIVFTLASCGEEISPVEKISVDQELLTKIKDKSSYDTLLSEKLGPPESWTIENYILDRKNLQNINRIMYDSTGKIIAITQIRDSFTVQMNVYFPNGQLTRISKFNNLGLAEGEVKMYNEAGRVVETGEYKNGIQTGTWKQYSDEGELVSELEFDAAGNPVQ